MRLKIISLLLLASMLVCSTANAKEQLMVKNLKPQIGVNAQTAEALSDIIKSALGEYYSAQSMDALAALSSVVEEKLKAGCDDTKCLIEVAGAMDIGLVVTGSISKLGSLYTLNMQLISTRGTNLGVIQRASEKCRCSEEELVNFAERVALNLIGKEPKVATRQNFSPSQVNTEPRDSSPSWSPLVPGNKGGVYKYTDERGVMHFASAENARRAETARLETEAEEQRRLEAKQRKADKAQKAGLKTNFMNSIGQTFEYIPPGTFKMGSPWGEKDRNEDERQHQVALTKGFYMQATEVTQGQWKAVMGTNPSHFSNCGDDCPVEQVSWNDCQKFIGKLNLKEGTNKYRLPTEAEWEYAARAGTSGSFAFGNCLSTEQANYDGNYPLQECSKGHYRQTPVRVGSFSSNAWGLYDMHGNVREWCVDWYAKDYSDSDTTDSMQLFSNVSRVYRGGSWISKAIECRSANRNSKKPDAVSGSVGFRLVAEQ